MSSNEAINRVLNHRPRDKNVETYIRYRFEKEDQALWEKVADFLMRMVEGGDAGNVVTGAFGGSRE
jgi:hypothetical protein